MPSDFTPNTVWGSSSPLGEQLTTPTGQTCQAKKLTIENMIEIGLLAETDSLTALVSKYVRKIKGAKGRPDGTEINEAAMLSDPEALKAIIGLTDKAIPHIVVSPRVVLHYIEQTVGKTKVTKALTEEQRNEVLETHPGTIFTDQIGLEDKMWLFDWAAGGIQTMTSFRSGSKTDVGSVGDVSGSPRKAKRSPGSN